MLRYFGSLGNERGRQPRSSLHAFNLHFSPGGIVLTVCLQVLNKSQRLCDLSLVTLFIAFIYI